MRVDDHPRVVERPLVDQRVGRGHRPVRAAVVGAPQQAVLGLDQRVDALGVARRDRQADAARMPSGKPLPLSRAQRRAAVGRLVEPVVGAAALSGSRPSGGSATARRRARRGAWDPCATSDAPTPGAAVERLAPARAAVAGDEHAALLAVAERVAQRRDDDLARVARVDQHARDLRGAGQAHSASTSWRRRSSGRCRRPGCTSLRGQGSPVPTQTSSAFVGRDRDRADRLRAGRVEHRAPVGAAVGRLPDAAAGRAGVEQRCGRGRFRRRPRPGRPRRPGRCCATAARAPGWARPTPRPTAPGWARRPARRAGSTSAAEAERAKPQRERARSSATTRRRRNGREGMDRLVRRERRAHPAARRAT